MVKMERNKNIDIIRALAILLILIYHIFALSHVQLFRGKLSPIIEYGGEYGVTIFFMLSGFAIYKSLSRRKDNFDYGIFIKDRLKRILPQYYISLIILICFSGGIVLLFTNKFDLFSHLFIIHGFFPSIQGSISGAAWTLTPIFCFYLVAPFLYKSIEKRPKTTLAFSIIFSCIFKYVIYSLFSISVNEISFGTYFAFGRSFLGVIDQFVIGMFLAKYINNPKNNKKIILNILLIILSLIGLYFWIIVDRQGIPIITQNTNRFSNCFEAYIWYSVLSIILSVGIFGFSQIKINYEFPFIKFLLCISKYEYGIYLWHLEFMRRLCEVNPFIQDLMVANRRSIYIYIGACTIFLGIIMSILIEGVDWKKVYNEFESYIKIFIYIFSAIVCYICAKEFILQIIGFVKGNEFFEYIFMILYTLAVEAFILYVLNRKNSNSKKLIFISGIGFCVAFVFKIFIQGYEELKFGLHLEYIVQMFQSMTIRFFNSTPHIVLLGLLLLGILMKLGECNNTTKKFAISNIIAMHITFVFIIFKYLLFFGEEAMAASSFIEFYSGIFSMQLITVIVLFVPRLLKNIKCLEEKFD